MVAFLLSFATLLSLSGGVAEPMLPSVDPKQEVDGIAIYLTAWTVVTLPLRFLPLSLLHDGVSLNPCQPPVFFFFFPTITLASLRNLSVIPTPFLPSDSHPSLVRCIGECGTTWFRSEN